MSAKLKKCIQNLDTGIFPANIAFIYNHTHEDVRKHFCKLKAWDWFAGLTGDEGLFKKTQCFACKRVLEDSTGRKPTKNLFYIVINRPFKKTNEDYIILAHEVTHICQFILPSILERDREIEAEAYLHSHIMRQILNIIT